MGFVHLIVSSYSASLIRNCETFLMTDSLANVKDSCLAFRSAPRQKHSQRRTGVSIPILDDET